MSKLESWWWRFLRRMSGSGLGSSTLPRVDLPKQNTKK